MKQTSCLADVQRQIHPTQAWAALCTPTELATHIVETAGAHGISPDLTHLSVSVCATILKSVGRTHEGGSMTKKSFARTYKQSS